MKALRTKAIVLRRTNYGESDRILQLLTPLGKRNVIAKGARREKSRLAGGIELFALCEVVITEGKGDLDILTSSRLSHFFNHIMQDYDRMQFAYLAIKLVAKASEMVDESDWYEVLAETLAGLNAKLLPLEIVQSWFFLRYSSLLGYELSLWQDISGDKLSSELSYRYDVGERGLRPVENGGLTSEHIKLLRLISSKTLKVLAQIGGTDLVLSDCLSVAREHASI